MMNLSRATHLLRNALQVCIDNELGKDCPYLINNTQIRQTKRGEK